MATLETDLYDFEYGVAPTQYTLESDLWSFQLGIPPTRYTLSTNLWVFSDSYPDGQLPFYNPSLITSVTKVQQNINFPQFVIAGQGGDTADEYKLFKKTNTQQFTVWRSPVYNIGQDFDVMRIKFNLGVDLDTGTSIIPKLYFDNNRSTVVGTVINQNNYSDKQIELTSKNFDNTTHGKHNFFLEFQFAGSDLAVISLPIFIDIETHEN